MSIFDKPAATTNPSRNGFDLSKRVLFTAYAGALQPIYHRYVMPGDHFKINVSSLTRTLPMNTDAFVRIREYVDFFFVPYRLLYRDFPDWWIQNTKSKDSSVSGTPLAFQTELPFIDMNDTLTYDQEFDTTDDMGLYYYNGVQRLADLLGYGNFYDVQIDPNQQIGNLPPSFFVNPFNACAYQKIYADFYRDSHWEDEDIVSWNLSPWARSNSHFVDASAKVSPRFFKMRYANYKKDILMSIHPNKQFGSVSIVPLNSGDPFYLRNQVTPSSEVNARVTTNGNLAFPNAGRWYLSNSNTSLQSVGISVLDIRMSEALQRWKEVTELNGFRYNEQVQAHFGFKVPDSRAQIAEFIDGWTNTINISEVVNTAENQGNISGKGVGVNQTHEIEFTPKEHGVIMAIYHIAPDLDYNQSRVDFDNTMRDYEDFYIPEYQNLGLSDLQTFNFSYPSLDDVQNHIFGYQLRYAHMKSDLDTCHGAFSATAPTSDLKKWVSPLDPLRIRYFLDHAQGAEDIDYRFFKVYPKCLDGLFALDTDGTVDNDKFLCNFFFDVKAVRPISVDGMPY